MKKSLNDRVQVREPVFDPATEETLLTAKTGVVVAVLDACKVYRKKPQYHPADRTSDRKQMKFPPGSECYKVLIDGEKHPRMFHEDQIVS